MYAALIFSTRPGALSCRRRSSTPQPDRRISRLSPALARTFRPGSSAVPLAERVMFLICRSSTRITSNRRAMSGGGLLGPVLAPVSLAGAQPGDGQPHPPAAVRAAARAGELALQQPYALAFAHSQAGYLQQFPGRQRRGHSHAPVNAHNLSGAGSGDRGGDGGEGDMPAPCAVHRHSVGLHPCGHRAGPAEPHPASLRHPDLADVAGHAADVPLLAAPPDDPEPFVPPSLTPRRPPGRVAPGRRSAPIAWAKSRNACCCTIWVPWASHGWAARACVSCLHCSR